MLWSWKTYAGIISHPKKIEGRDVGRPMRLVGWPVIRWLTEAFKWDDAVAVKVGSAEAAAGYRLGLREEGSDKTLVLDEVLHYEDFAVVVSPRPWTLFLIDRSGNDGVDCQVAPRCRKDDPEVQMPLI